MFSILIYFKCDYGKAEFSASILQSSHDPSEIILIWCIGDQETVIIIIHVENNCAACLFIYFKPWYILKDFYMSRNFKRIAFI